MNKEQNRKDYTYLTKQLGVRDSLVLNRLLNNILESYYKLRTENKELKNKIDMLTKENNKE